MFQCFPGYVLRLMCASVSMLLTNTHISDSRDLLNTVVQANLFPQKSLRGRTESGRNSRKNC